MNMTTHRLQQQLSLSALAWVGPLTLLACISTNIVIRTIAVTFFEVSASFQPLQPPTIIISTIVYLLLATGAFLLISRLSRQPVSMFRLLATICLLLSLAFPLMALTGAFPTPGMNAHIFLAMVAMHLISAVIVIALLPTAITRR